MQICKFTFFDLFNQTRCVFIKRNLVFAGVASCYLGHYDTLRMEIDLWLTQYYPNYFAVWFENTF